MVGILSRKKVKKQIYIFFIQLDMGIVTLARVLVELLHDLGARMQVKVSLRNLLRTRGQDLQMK